MTGFASFQFDSNIQVDVVDGGSLTWNEPPPTQVVQAVANPEDHFSSRQLHEGTINANLSWQFDLTELNFRSLVILFDGTTVAGVTSSGFGPEYGFVNQYDIDWIPNKNFLTLIIFSVTTEQNGKFTCRVAVHTMTGFASFQFDSHIQVDVVAPPSNIAISSDVSVTAPAELTLNCSADGIPKPTITWTRVSDGIVVTMPLNITGGMDGGGYRCTVDNGVGKLLRKDVFVDVQVLRCQELLPPANGKLESGVCGNMFGRVCRLQCNKGYELKGSVVRTCDRISGTDQVHWTGNATYCEAVECPSLNTTDHVEKTGYGCSGPTSTFGTVCFFSCILGFEVAGGSRHRTCQENREWSGAQLQCRGVTCPAMNVKSEGLIVSPPACANSSGSLGYAAICRFTCKKGYQLLGPRLKLCAQNTRWFPLENPSCRDVSGPAFSNCPSNILKSADRGTTWATVTWTAPKATDNSEFIPNVTHSGKSPGEKFAAGEHSIRYVGSDKTGNVGECKFKVFISVIRCVPRLHAPAGGTKFCTKDNIYGSECSFSCHIVYTRVGSSKRVCEKNTTTSTGFWTGNETHCEYYAGRLPYIFPTVFAVLVVLLICVFKCWISNREAKKNDYDEERGDNKGADKQDQGAYAQSGPPAANGAGAAAEQEVGAAAIPTYEVDKSKKKKTLDEPKKEKKPGELLYAGLGDFHNPGMPTVSISPQPLPDPHERTDHAKIPDSL
ncbi:uncharacterized protein [Acropora muricata]